MKNLIAQSNMLLSETERGSCTNIKIFRFHDSLCKGKQRTFHKVKLRWCTNNQHEITVLLKSSLLAFRIWNKLGYA